MPDNPGIFSELKRRHVWRVAVAYAVTGWLIIQIATQVFPAFHMPDWAAQLVVILVLLGFPVVLVLAWAFEITPEGIRRTVPADSPDARQAHEAHSVGRLLNSVIITVLILAVGLLGWRLLVLQRTAAPTPKPLTTTAPQTVVAKPLPAATPIAAQPIPAKSIAVLPFQNLSDDKANEYFVSGMQDLILAKLADIGELKVISRTSTMQYKSRPDNLKTVAAELGVATILEGSVQKQGKRVLVSVQLVDARSDTHLWAETYQRTLDDIFGVEGEVADKIATALNAKLSPAQVASLAAVPTTNQAAYDLFLRAEFQLVPARLNGGPASFRAVLPLYRQAIALDPGFALAYARLSFSEGAVAWFGGVGNDLGELTQQADAHAEHALKLAPELAAAHVAVGFSHYHGHRDYAAALKAFDAALALSPNDVEALAARGYVQRRQGHFEASVASLQEALARDPRSSKLAVEIGFSYMALSHFDEAEPWMQRALALDPRNVTAKVSYSNAIAFGTGDIVRALATLPGDVPGLVFQRVYLLILQRRYDEAITLLEGAPDTSSRFGGNTLYRTKGLLLADLYRMAGNTAKARPLFEQSLSAMRAQLARQQGIIRAFGWRDVAVAELGLGHAEKGLEAIAEVQAIVARANDAVAKPILMESCASLYAQAKRPDLAVPLLARALATRGIGTTYSPALLWLDPWWDPIRGDPGFQALLQQYARFKPAVIYVAPVAARATSADTGITQKP